MNKFDTIISEYTVFNEQPPVDPAAAAAPTPAPAPAPAVDPAAAQPADAEQAETEKVTPEGLIMLANLTKKALFINPESLNDPRIVSSGERLKIDDDVDGNNAQEIIDIVRSIIEKSNLGEI